MHPLSAARVCESWAQDLALTRVRARSWTSPPRAMCSTVLGVSPVFGATGVPRSKETATPWDPTVGLCLGPYGGPS